MAESFRDGVQVLKKYIMAMVLLVFMIVLLPNTASGAQDIRVYLDGLPVVSEEAAPLIMDGRVMVPFRAVAESLNAEVNWDPGSQKVTAVREGITVVLQIGNQTAWRNGQAVSLDRPPIIINGRTLIPLRFFMESLGCQVGWNGQTYEVTITSPRKAMTITGFYALGDSRTSSWTNLFGKPYPEFDKGNTDVVGDLALGWYSVDAQGNLLTRSNTGWQRPDSWEKVLEAADTLGLRYEMVIHVTEKDNTITNLMSDDSAVQNFVSAVLAESQIYDGVNLDFEGLGLGSSSPADRQLFTRLVSRLYSSLQSVDKTLTLTLHAPNSSYKGYDYKALGAVSDQIIIMAYDYGPKPEPDQLVIQAVEMAIKEVPADKLVLGISLPSETPESLAKRIGIAKRYNLSGVALWRLGLVSEQNWQVIRGAIVPRS